MTSDVDFYSKLALGAIESAISCYQSGLEWLDRPEYCKGWRMDSVTDWAKLSDNNLEAAVKYARTAARFALPMVLLNE